MKLPEKPFAWTLKDRETAFRNSWIAVERIDATDPGGQPAEYGVVRFANLAIGIVPYENGRIWLVGQSRVPFERYSWEIPAGGGDKANPLDAAHRELAEETGFRADRMEVITKLQMSNSVTDEEAIIYLATGLTKGETNFESSEDISLVSMTLDEGLELIEAGELVDGLTVTALYKLALMRAKGKLDGL